MIAKKNSLSASIKPIIGAAPRAKTMGMPTDIKISMIHINVTGIILSPPKWNYDMNTFKILLKLDGI